MQFRLFPASVHCSTTPVLNAAREIEIASSEFRFVVGFEINSTFSLTPRRYDSSERRSLYPATARLCRVHSEEGVAARTRKGLDFVGIAWERVDSTSLAANGPGMTTSFNPLTAPHDSAFAGPSSSTSTARPSPLPPPRSTAFAPPSSTTASNRRPSIQSPRPLPKPSSLAGSSRPYSPPQHPTKRFPSPPTQPLLPAQANNSNFNTGGRFAASVVSSTTRRPDSNSLAGNSTAPSADELSQFAAVCRLLYYEKDPTAAIKVDSILSKLAAGSRTAYARTMAKVRAEYHLSEEIRRRQEVEKVLEVKPGSEVMKALRISEGGTSAMRSKVARRVRQESLRAFIKSHCVRDMPGTLPFFKSLYAVMYLQSLAAKKGGAGKRRVEWEIDVAVFTEAGAGDWLIDSVTFLKAVSLFSLSHMACDV